MKKNPNGSTNNYVGYKVRLFPTKKQEKVFYEYFWLNRFVYNLGINIKQKHYADYKEGKEQYIKLLDFDLHNRVSDLKKNDPNYECLRKFNWSTITLTLDDLNKAYDNHFDHNKGWPKYKTAIYSKKQFPIRSDRLAVEDRTVRIPSIGHVKYCNSYGDEILGSGDKGNKSHDYCRYTNARISFDGIYFYLSFSIPKDENHQANSYWNYADDANWEQKEYSEPIGIDVGLKNDKWMVDSTGYTLERPNSDSLNKKINRLMRKYQRQKDTNLRKNSSFIEQYPNGSKNMQKTLVKINKCFKKITNRRRNAVQEYACQLLQQKPSAVVMESISVSKLYITDNTKKCNTQKLKMNHLYLDAALDESMTIIQNKMISNGIPVIKAPSDYPSSQLCSCCGFRQNIGRKKIYTCPECGTIINRDLNAAINLAKLVY